MNPVRDTPEVAILLSTSSGWGRRIVKGILAYAAEAGPWHLWVQPNAPRIFEQLPEGWRGDGIIARVVDSRLAAALDESRLPVVNVADFALEGFSAPCVRTDDRASTRMAVEHFKERGLRNVAIAAPRHNPNPIWYADAFAEAAASEGLPCSFFALKGNRLEQTDELVQWLGSLTKPVGILVWGQVNGVFVVDCCMRAGLSVPHDVAVLDGSYDEVLCHACFPPLSGILIPTEQIGYRAAEALHGMMLGEEVPHKTTYLPPLGIMEHLSTDTLNVEDPKMAKVARYIREHACGPIAIDDILRAVPMSRRALERRFRQAFGRSAFGEVRRLRVNKARQLLAQTDMPMQHIAEACGYASYNYLTNVFKKTTGMSPRDYRRQLKSL